MREMQAPQHRLRQIAESSDDDAVTRDPQLPVIELLQTWNSTLIPVGCNQVTSRSQLGVGARYPVRSSIICVRYLPAPLGILISEFPRLSLTICAPSRR